MRAWWERGSRKPLGLKDHVSKVQETVEELSKQLRAWVRKEPVEAERVSEREHQADLVKREIRLVWARSRLLLPKDRLLELLWHQDEIADLSQDAALLMALCRPELPLELEDAFRALGEIMSKTVHGYAQAVATFEEAYVVGKIKEKGSDLSAQVDLVHRLEHESDLLEREIVATVYRAENLPAFDRYHLVQLVLLLGDTVDQVENAAGDLSMLMAPLL